MDITPFLHALCAVAAQLLIGLFTGNWAYGAIAGCTCMGCGKPDGFCCAGGGVSAGLAVG